MKVSACIFDLDGVVVDTAKYHYLAWKRLAAEHGFDFTEHDNERLKGVSRMASLEILLEIGQKSASPQEKELMAARKNAWYVEYIENMDPSEILPGAQEFIENLRGRGIKVALGSASKNARLILNRIGLVNHFDTIVDGTRVVNAKPNPEVFLIAASDLGVTPAECLVFEDAEAGVEAAINGGMRCVGVGNPLVLSKANIVIDGFKNLSPNDIFDRV
ncbi:MAG: beta-phosphoglucomutase [Tenuifilaceae bacterium]|nr:beta-phosphoglucomutase [Tenuifilaceae bacterium]